MATRKRIYRFLTVMTIVVTAMVACAPRAHGLSLALDSIATWGKFPRFCVNTYRWGDKFFNTYDSTYVQGTGYKFNVKFKTDTWLDNYIFEMPDDYTMHMRSDFCTSAGVWATYLALSAGYDINVSKYIGGSETSRKRYNFVFNCALLSANFYWITNDVGTTITTFGPRGHTENLNIRFEGINTSIFGLDAYYHFNNKRYSRAAAFNYSKIQKRSQGSWFLGFSYWQQDFTFDFKDLPASVVEKLPPEWAEYEYVYHSNSHNYSLRGGYSYNWVFAPHWLLGVSESPILGYKKGTLTGDSAKFSLSLYNRFQLSVIWNNKRWFAGIIGAAENGLFFAKKNTLMTGIFSFEASCGFRFNIW